MPTSCVYADEYRLVGFPAPILCPTAEERKMGTMRKWSAWKNLSSSSVKSDHPAAKPHDATSLVVGPVDNPQPNLRFVVMRVGPQVVDQLEFEGHTRRVALTARGKRPLDVTH